MVARCHDPEHDSYVNYGARGIVVCDRWRFSVHAFIDDMGKRPEGMSIERKDNNGRYEPDNCRWATQAEQMRNTRRNRILSFNGITLCVSDWAKRLKVARSVIQSRLDSGWSIERTLTT
jgi:hypothetical protein